VTEQLISIETGQGQEMGIQQDSRSAQVSGPEQSSSATPLNFFAYDREGLGAEIVRRYNEPEYRATQLFQWVYKRGVRSVSEMSDLSRAFRSRLEQDIQFPIGTIRSRQLSNDGSRKYAIEVGQGDLVESVMIKQPRRMTLCVSSQVGCAMGCKFCRTATMGLKRHLSVSEILQQVMAVIEDAKEFGDMFTNVVFMGMGEPLHNIQNIRTAIRTMTDMLGLGIAPRKITVSTVGLVPAIREFGATVPANIAVSLNATTDEIRSQIMPVNIRYPLADLLEVLREYPVKKRKRITIEYVMLSGVNDTEQDLRRLPMLLRGIAAKVNLIPYNENAGLGFKTPAEETILGWQRRLTQQGVEATIRWSKGRDIDAACGQLLTASSQRTSSKRATLEATTATP
jgi:23S rRNA (adenine2503-C2)-methyltransferase